MDATAEGLGLLQEAIRPPRLEDAGLEDCALPPEAIREAFSKAADYVKSRIIADEDDEDGYRVEDAGPTNGEVPDARLGTGEIPTKPLCGGAGEKGGFPAGEEAARAGDMVVVSPGDIKGDTSSDKVVVLGGEDGVRSDGGGEKACVGEEAQEGDKKKETPGEEEEDDGDEGGKLLQGEVLI